MRLQVIRLRRLPEALALGIDKMKILHANILLIFSALSLCSCQTQMNDSSSLPMYSGIIGNKYQTNEDLIACSIAENNNRKNVAYVLVMPKPGIGGFEVIKRETLPKGTVFEIVSVQTSDFNLIENRTMYVIKMQDNLNYQDKQVSIYFAFDSYVYSSNKNEAPKLNKKYFTPLN